MRGCINEAKREPSPHECSVLRSEGGQMARRFFYSYLPVATRSIQRGEVSLAFKRSKNVVCLVLRINIRYCSSVEVAKVHADPDFALLPHQDQGCCVWDSALLNHARLDHYGNEIVDDFLFLV